MNFQPVRITDNWGALETYGEGERLVNPVIRLNLTNLRATLTPKENAIDDAALRSASERAAHIAGGTIEWADASVLEAACPDARVTLMFAFHLPRQLAKVVPA